MRITVFKCVKVRGILKSRLQASLTLAHQELLGAPVMLSPSWWQWVWWEVLRGGRCFPAQCVVFLQTVDTISWLCVFLFVWLECVLEVFLYFKQCGVIVLSAFHHIVTLLPNNSHLWFPLVWVKFFCLSIILIELVGGCGELNSHNNLSDPRSLFLLQHCIYVTAEFSVVTFPKCDSHFPRFVQEKCNK